LDDLSSTFSESAGGSNGVGNLGYLDPRNPMLDYGNSDFDIRHRLVVSAIWQDPFFKSGRGFAKTGSGWLEPHSGVHCQNGSAFHYRGTAQTRSAVTAPCLRNPTLYAEWNDHQPERERIDANCESE